MPDEAGSPHASSDRAPAPKPTGKPPGGGVAWRIHGLAGAALATILAIAFCLAVALLARAAHVPDRTGPLLAFFPRGWTDDARLEAAARAGGVIMARGGVPGLVEVTADEPGLAHRLSREGAWLVLAPLPASAFGLDGCGAGLLPRAPARPVRMLPV